MHSLFGVIYMQFDQVSLFLILWVLIIDRYRLLPESQKKEGLFSVVGVRNGSQKVPFYTSCDICLILFAYRLINLPTPSLSSGFC